MRTDRLAWSQVACDNLKKAGATDEIFYYRRVLGKEKYAAHVFIAQYASQEQLASAMHSNGLLREGFSVFLIWRS